MIPSNHPRDVLGFYLENEPSKEAGIACQQLIEELARDFVWLLGPPAFVDETEVVDGQAIRTFGGYIESYSAMPNGVLDVETDRTCLREAEVFIERIGRYSRQYDLVLVITFRDEEIGEIRNGVPDKCVRIGLLQEWRRCLEQT